MRGGWIEGVVASEESLTSGKDWRCDRSCLRSYSEFSHPHGSLEIETLLNRDSFSVFPFVNYLSVMRPDKSRDPIAGPDGGPTSPFPVKLCGEVIKGFGRGSKEVDTFSTYISPSMFCLNFLRSADQSKMDLGLFTIFTHPY